MKPLRSFTSREFSVAAGGDGILTERTRQGAPGTGQRAPGTGQRAPGTQHSVGPYGAPKAGGLRRRGAQTQKKVALKRCGRLKGVVPTGGRLKGGGSKGQGPNPETVRSTQHLAPNTAWGRLEPRKREGFEGGEAQGTQHLPVVFALQNAMFLHSTLSCVCCIRLAGQRIMLSMGSVFHRPGLLLSIESCQVVCP